MAEEEKEQDLTVGENASALGCALLVLFAGGGLAVWGHGSKAEWAQMVGGLVGLIGVILANVQFWALLRSLWRGKYK